MTGPVDPLGMTVGELLARLLERQEVSASAWVDIRDPASPVPYRVALAAAQRGELAVHRIGRRGLVLRAHLDAWITSQPTLADTPVTPKTEPSAAERILAREGWRRTG